MNNFSAISWRDQATFDEIIMILRQTRLVRFFRIINNLITTHKQDTQIYNNTNFIIRIIHNSVIFIKLTVNT
jgi:hypothetical protein